MSEVVIIPYDKQYFSAVRRICYQTGYMGEDLSDRHLFDDENLFCLVICDYYLRCEPQHCFVAINTEEQVVGYIIGTASTKDVSKNFIRILLPKILGRIFAVSIWRYPRSVLQLLRFMKNRATETEIVTSFPAHFHTNISNDYQSQGIGKKLLLRFEQHMLEQQIPAIHLSTSTKNEQALGFYEHFGYKILDKSDKNLWSIEGVKHIIMGKLLIHGDNTPGNPIK